MGSANGVCPAQRLYCNDSHSTHSSATSQMFGTSVVARSYQSTRLTSSYFKAFRSPLPQVTREDALKVRFRQARSAPGTAARAQSNRLLTHRRSSARRFRPELTIAREIIEIPWGAGGDDADCADPAAAIRLAGHPAELHRLLAFFEADAGMCPAAIPGHHGRQCDAKGSGAERPATYSERLHEPQFGSFPQSPLFGRW